MGVAVDLGGTHLSACSQMSFWKNKDRALPNEKLLSFYESFGFKVTRPGPISEMQKE